jgi:hypothetical protein
MPRIVTSGLTAATTYWIRFWKGATATSEGTFSICIYEKPTCGAIVPSTAGCPTPPAFTSNANGNFNGTVCSTSDPIGLCAEKIPTIGTNFAPLCGDNFNAKAYYGVGPASTNTALAPTTFTVGSTAGLQVGSVLHTGTGGAPTFPVGTTITGILSATQYTTSSAPSITPMTGITININQSPTGENPPNSLFCTSAALPNAHMILRPIFYRINPYANGTLQIDFDNILTARNQGVRVAMYTLSPEPTLPTHSCAGATWTLFPANYISNTFGVSAVGVNRYCNTNAVALAAGLTGNPNTAKFTMRWNAVVAGKVYFLMVDGSGPQNQADRAFFTMSLSGTSVSANGVLAAKLLSFKGKNEDGVNQLQWFTGSEQDNDYFELQKSKDGENFEKLTEVPGKGNSSSLSVYNAFDENPFAGLTYYRLRLVDKQGIGTYSEIISVNSPTGKKIEFVGVHPNPTSEVLFTEFYLTEATALTVEIRDISGKLVKAFNASLAAGKNNLASDMAELEGGLYFMTLKDIKSGEHYTARFVRQ